MSADHLIIHYILATTQKNTVASAAYHILKIKGKQKMSVLPKDAKKIPGFPGYYATLDGRVWSEPKTGIGYNHPGRFLSLGKASSGYLIVVLSKERKRYTKSVHRIILETFSGKPSKNLDCCHNNGDRLDNRIENLRWDTRKNNEADKVKHGTDNRGERHSMAKLDISQVRHIRRLLLNGVSNQREIAKLFGVHFSTINKIAKNVNWATIF